MASHFDGQIFAVSNGTVTPLPRLFGLDYSTILQDWMGTSSENKEINSLLELYKAYKENEMQPQVDAVKRRILELLHYDTESEILKKL